MASYEVSEITTAIALMYSRSDLLELSKNKEGLLEILNDSYNEIKHFSVQNDAIQFGSSDIKNGFANAINVENLKGDNKKISALVKDMAVGVSAALEIKKQVLGSDKPDNITVYMTGDKWPDEVQDFKVSAYGFKDYNSSDIIITDNKKNFYGVSLKKKPKVKAADPTLINKAFDTVLDEKSVSGKQLSQIKKLKSDLENTRMEYFTDLVIEAVESGIIRYQDINDLSGNKIKTEQQWNQFKNSQTGRKELFDSKKRDKKLFGDYAYIDTKGYAGSNKGYLNDVTTDKKSMRYFVNSKLSKSDSRLWTEILKVMNEYKELFAELLLNIILKTKLYDELSPGKLEKLGYSFQFFLVTGVADVKNNGDADIGHSHVIPLKTTLCGLDRLGLNPGNDEDTKYKIVIDQVRNDASSAAKIYMTLMKGSFPILDLEIRYKGSFRPQPQFQATINDKFKSLMDKECSGGRG